MKLARKLEKKLLSPKRAQAWATKLRKKKAKLVFTNGCFDLLHPGHVQYLQAARNKGDALIVALDCDASVRQLKGIGRPLNTLEKRMTVIAALESVDAVTWFEDSNPIPLIKTLRPSVLVKGGDWDVEKILGAKEVFEDGGKVFSISYVEGCSTTALVKQISGTYGRKKT